MFNKQLRALDYTDLARLSLSQLWEVFSAANARIEAICAAAGLCAAEDPGSEELQLAAEIVARRSAPSEFALRQRASDEIVLRWLIVLEKTSTSHRLLGDRKSGS